MIDRESEEAPMKAVRCVARSYPRGTIVVSEGDRTDTQYIILSGRVRVFVPTGAARK